MNEQQPSSLPEARPEPRTSYRTAFILCVLLGWLGGHRYYMRLWGTAILYNFSFGLFGIGVLVDLLTLPLLVRERRDIEAGIPLPPTEASWADGEQASWWSWFQLMLRYAILILAPPITVILAISFGQYIAVALVFLLLAFSLLVGSISRGLYGLEDVKELAGGIKPLELGVKAMAITSRIERHYSEHRTGSVFYYLLYPLLVPFAMLFSPRARREFRQFLSLFYVMVIGVVAHNLWNYRKIYFTDATSDPVFGLVVSVFLGVAGIILFFGCVVPMVSSSFYLSKTGRSLSLRGTAAVALAICGWAVVWSRGGDSIPVRATLTILEKFNSPNFKQEFTATSKLFLAGEMYRLRFDRGSQADLTYRNGAQVVREERLTKWYRNLAADLFRDEEAKALSVVSVYPGDGPPWLAIRLDPDPLRMRGALGGAVLLYAASPDGQVFTRWDTLESYNPRIRGCFQVYRSGSVVRTTATALQTSAPPNRLTTLLLVDDLGYVPILGPLKSGVERPNTLRQWFKLDPLDLVPAPEPAYHTLYDDTGTKEVRARITALVGGFEEHPKVQLQPEDRERIWVPLNRLGPNEQSLVWQWQEEQYLGIR